MQLQLKILNNQDINNYQVILKKYIKKLIKPYTEKDVFSETQRIYDNMNIYTLNETAIIIGAFDEQNLIGFIWGYRKLEKPQIVHINYFYINEEYRNMGIGTQLLNEICMVRYIF